MCALEDQICELKRSLEAVSSQNSAMQVEKSALDQQISDLTQALSSKSKEFFSGCVFFPGFLNSKLLTSKTPRTRDFAAIPNLVTVASTQLPDIAAEKERGIEQENIEGGPTLLVNPTSPNTQLLEIAAGLRRIKTVWQSQFAQLDRFFANATRRCAALFRLHSSIKTVWQSQFAQVDRFFANATRRCALARCLLARLKSALRFSFLFFLAEIKKKICRCTLARCFRAWLKGRRQV
jgi:hypothetical protein